MNGWCRTLHTTHAAALKTTTRPKTRCRKPYAAAQLLMLLMMGVCTRNVSSWEYINKITLLHQVGIPHYFTRKMHCQTTLKFSYIYYSSSPHVPHAPPTSPPWCDQPNDIFWGNKSRWSSARSFLQSPTNYIFTKWHVPYYRHGRTLQVKICARPLRGGRLISLQAVCFGKDTRFDILREYHGLPGQVWYKHK